MTDTINDDPAPADEEIIECPWCTAGFLRLVPSERTTGHTAPLCEEYKAWLATCRPGSYIETKPVVRLTPERDPWRNKH